MMNAAHDFEEKKKNSINITYYPFSYGLPRELRGNPHPPIGLDDFSWV